MTVPAINLLWSYAYARTKDMAKHLHSDVNAPNGLRFFADSGAHSARTLGIDLDVALYAEWLKQWHKHMTIYANLDVIGAPRATRHNQRALESEGLSPMPVFHTGEPFDVLAGYLDDGYTYIALGKLLGNHPTHLKPWLDRCFSMAHGRAVFHGFGMTTWSLLRRYPWYTVDSSSWGSSFRYGVIKLFDRGRWAHVRLRDRDSIRANARILESYGVDLHHLTLDGYTRPPVARISAAAVYRANDWLADHHGPVELPKGKGYPTTPLAPGILPAWHGRRMVTYLADTTLAAHKLHADGVVADANRHKRKASA